MEFKKNFYIYYKGADVKKTDKEGLTALSWACHQGHRHAVMTLLDKGSSVNAIDKNGRTPLDLAATCSDPQIVQGEGSNKSTSTLVRCHES
jgi:ankyrin repeat protein